MTTTSTKQTAADVIASQFIEALEGGILPWEKPWLSFGFQNYVSKKQYRGINVLLCAILGKGETHFLTFNQIKALKGATLNKGSKSIPIFFMSPVENKSKLDANGKPTKFFLSRYYRVFRASDVEGIKKPELPNADNFSPIEVAEKFATLSTCPVEHGKGNIAAYYPGEHRITMPSPELFKSASHYYATLFHEIGHSLKGESKDADDITERVKGSYSFEELCAEIFSAMAINHCGLHSPDIFDNSANYVGGWLKKLKGDPSFIIKAASKAQKRLDALLGVTFKEENNEE